MSDNDDSYQKQSQDIVDDSNDEQGNNPINPYEEKEDSIHESGSNNNNDNSLNPYNLNDNDDDEANDDNNNDSAKDKDLMNSNNDKNSEELNDNSENKSDEQELKSTNNDNPYKIDEDASLSSDSVPRAVAEDDPVVDNEEKPSRMRKILSFFEKPNTEGDDYSNLPFLVRFKWALIATIPTFIFLIIAIAVTCGVKKDPRMHVVDKTLEIVDKRGGYFLWGCHCVSLLCLPFLLVILFKEEAKIYQMFASPVMMLLNMIAGMVPMNGTFFPLIIELLIVIFLLFHLPLKSVYIPKRENFWLGEITLMCLGFIYISSALGSSTLSYYLYGSYIRIEKYFMYKMLEGYVPTPNEAILIFDELDKEMSQLDVKGRFLACYSLFTFLSIGIGFAMSMKNSILMAIPFLTLCICTVIETHSIGTLLFFQLIVHIIYIISLHFSKSRRVEAGCCCDCCFECCYATLTTVMIGDFIGFCLFAFPIVQLSIFKDGPVKFNWGAFIGGAFLLTVSMVFHILTSLDGKVWALFVAVAGFLASTLIYGLSFAGYTPIIRAFTYEITYVSWSFALCFWGYSSGYSPLLYKVYNALISLAAVIIVDMYEGVGWIEIIFAIVQVVFDTYVVVYAQRLEEKYIAWAVFSVAGVLVMGFLVAVACAIIAALAYFILRSCCKCCADAHAEVLAEEYAAANGLRSGDTFECAGRTFRVV